MNPENKMIFLSHAIKEMPREACAFLVNVRGKEILKIVQNQAKDLNDFLISPRDLMDAEDLGQIIGVVHSHVNKKPIPSEADIYSCEKSGVEWHILSVPSGEWNSISPSGKKIGLLGRPYVFGVFDCYSLIRDYFKTKLSINLPEFERVPDFWKHGRNDMIDNYEKAGFYQVFEDPKPNDVILFMISSHVVNHCGVYLGNNRFIHHAQGRLSTEEIFGGFYQKNAFAVLRFKQ